MSASQLLNGTRFDVFIAPSVRRNESQRNTFKVGIPSWVATLGRTRARFTVATFPSQSARERLVLRYHLLPCILDGLHGEPLTSEIFNRLKNILIVAMVVCDKSPLASGQA